MAHKLLRAALVAAAVLIVVPEFVVAQINITGENHSQGRSNANSAAHPSGLGIVPEDFAKLKIGPGFLIGLNVLEDTDFQGNFRVDENGDIELPILGSVHVAGKTALEASDQIKKRLLQGQILKDPQVSLNVVEYTAPQVTIIGEVGAPGKYPLLVPRNLIDVLALAGGPGPLAGNQVSITPANAQDKPVLIHYSKATDPKTVANVMVNPGDTVQVKRAGIVYVLGAVNRPGGFVMQEDGTLNVLQAISLANGTSVPASTGTIYLLRRNADGTEINIALPYKKISTGKRADVQLHATDILFVPTSKIKSILSNSQGVISSAASASIYAGFVY